MSKRCKIWTGALTARGRPYVKRGRKNIFVSRMILEQKLGRPIRPGYFALHTCNNQRCVERTHLYEGTHRNNMQDRMRDTGYRTQAKGDAHGRAILTAANVRFIRRARARGVTLSVLAARFGVYKSTIRDADIGKTWPHVPA